MAHIQIIIGSTRPGRVGKAIADWYVKDLNFAGLDFEIIDLAEVDLPLLDEAVPASANQYANDHTKIWAERIAKADGYIWVTPEYNHAPNAALLNAISYLKKEWAYKPVAFVGYGTLGASRAIETLVSVASELDMVAVRDRVSVLEPWISVDSAGNINADYIKGDRKAQLDKLATWLDATKTIRKS